MPNTPVTDPTGRRRWPVALVTTGLLLGGAAVGAIGVAAANAAPASVSASPTASPSDSPSDGTKSHRSSETAVTGTKAATLKAAALKAVPGATVDRVETDSDGAAYEVHLTETDGIHVTVKFDSALKQTGIETRTSKSDGGRHGTETAVTGTKAATLKAAALKAVPGATVNRVETDSDGAAYEVHLTKTDGTHVTVKFDSALKQTGIETGNGGRHGRDRASGAE